MPLASLSLSSANEPRDDCHDRGGTHSSHLDEIVLQKMQNDQLVVESVCGNRGTIDATPERRLFAVSCTGKVTQLRFATRRAATARRRAFIKRSKRERAKGSDLRPLTEGNDSLSAIISAVPARLWLEYSM